MNDNQADIRAIIADIENDEIDKSQWLPKRSLVLTEAREGRGDIEKINNRYVCKHKLVVDLLLAKRHINQAQHMAAMDIISLHEVAMSSQGYARLRLSAEWLGRGAITDECPLTVYVRVIGRE